MDERLKNISEEINYLATDVGNEISKRIQSKQNKENYQNVSEFLAAQSEVLKNISRTEYEKLNNVSQRLKAYTEYITKNIAPAIQSKRNKEELLALTDLLTELSEELKTMANPKQQATQDLVSVLKQIAQKNEEQPATTEEPKTIEYYENEVNKSKKTIEKIEEFLKELEEQKDSMTQEEYNKNLDYLAQRRIEEQQKIVDNTAIIDLYEKTKISVQELERISKISPRDEARIQELINEIQQNNQKLPKDLKYQDIKIDYVPHLNSNKTSAKLADRKKELEDELSRINEQIEKEEKENWDNLVGFAYDQNTELDKKQELEKMISQASKNGFSQEVIDKLTEELNKTKENLDKLIRKTNRYANKFPQAKPIETQEEKDWNKFVGLAYQQNKELDRVKELEQLISQATRNGIPQEIINNLTEELNKAKENLKKKTQSTNRYANKFPQTKPEESQEEKDWNKFVGLAYQQNKELDRIRELEQLISQAKANNLSQEIIDNLTEELNKLKEDLNKVTRETNRYAGKFPQTTPVEPIPVPAPTGEPEPEPEPTRGSNPAGEEEPPVEENTGKKKKGRISGFVKKVRTSLKKVKIRKRFLVGIGLTAAALVLLASSRSCEKKHIVRGQKTTQETVTTIDDNTLDETPTDNVITYYDDENTQSTGELVNMEPIEDKQEVPLEDLWPETGTVSEQAQDDYIYLEDETTNNLSENIVGKKVVLKDGAHIYDTMLDSALEKVEKQENPKYNSGVVIGVGMWNPQTGFSHVYSHDPNFEEKIKTSLANGGEYISVLTCNELDYPGRLPQTIEETKKYATGWHNIGEVVVENQEVNTRGVSK